MKTTKIIIGIVLLAVVVFLIIKPQQNNELTGGLEKVDVGYSALRISLPVFVAEENGYFEEEGLDVNLVRFDTAQPLMSALVAGTVDVAGYTALPITYNAMIRSEVDLNFVTAMMEDQKHRISYLVVPEGTPEEFSISDLKGKSIGILPTVAYSAWVNEILKANGIDPETDVNIVQIAPALQPAALESGQVDALFTNDPAATTAIQQGVGRTISENVEVPMYLGEPFLFGSFNIRKDFADANPEAAEKITNALNKAVKFVNRNPQEAKMLMTSYLHESQQPYVEFYPDALYKESNKVSDKDFQEVSDQYLEIGIIQESLSLEGLSF
jgi:NitT/TauT family transport system substrate-binding protein